MQNGYIGHENGQSLVEFAAISLALVMLLMGVFEFGRQFYNYSAVVNAAQEGARFGATTGVNNQTKRDAIISRTISSTLAVGEGQPWVSVNCAVDCGTVGTGGQFTVTVNYTFTAIMPFIPSFVFSRQASMMIDHSP